MISPLFTATLGPPPEPRVPGWWQNVPCHIWNRKDREKQDGLSLNTEIPGSQRPSYEKAVVTFSISWTLMQAFYFLQRTQ